LGWVLAMPILLAAIIGHGFGKPDLWLGELLVQPFLAVRPLGAEEKIAVKMKVALASASLAWLLVSAFLALWLPLWANRAALREGREAALALRAPAALWVMVVLVLTVCFLLTWRGMVGSLWAAMSGSVQRYVVSLVLQCIAWSFAIWCVFFWTHRFEWARLEQYVSRLEWTLALALAAKFWLAAFTWRGVSAAQTGRYVLAWVSGTACVVALGWLLCPDVFWLKPLVVMGALLPFPLARMGLAPNALRSNQHRA